MILALLGFAGMFMTALLGPSRIEKLYQPSLTTSPEPTLPSASAKNINPVNSSPPTVAPALMPIGDVSNIVLLVDTSASMQGQRIQRVQAALTDFISHLDNSYLISVIQFDTDVELRMGLTPGHAEAREIVKSLTVDVADDGACIHDALYAGIQETTFAPAEKDTRNIVIILTDARIYESDLRGNCGINFGSEVVNLAAKYPVSIFAVLVDNADVLSVVDWMEEMQGASFSAINANKDVLGSLRSLSEGIVLQKNDEPVTSDSSGLATAAARQASMMFVPPGEFVMGNTWVNLDPFWIDKTEVTNTMYAGCVQAGRCRPPRETRSRTRDRYFWDPVYADYPVIFVSWEDAHHYCGWAGRRMPTEAEWEKAARGIGGQAFPWGDADPAGSVDLVNYHSQDTTEVGIFPNGASPYGVLDMAGNVGEWVADWLSVEYYSNPPASNPPGPDSGQYRVWRGGSWANTGIESLRTYTRTGNLPADSRAGIGFRCAREAAP